METLTMKEDIPWKYVPDSKYADYRIYIWERTLIMAEGVLDEDNGRLHIWDNKFESYYSTDYIDLTVDLDRASAKVRLEFGDTL